MPTQEKDRAEIILFLENVKGFLAETMEEEEIWIIFYPISRIVFLSPDVQSASFSLFPG